ncbi:MAG TPA: LuxR C-terminal-related transcriptional regulator [Myxococcaceae bacterium]|nr:LuxR C-terminal-related transcriptional regulator [Myxococcaceae bacterium]
MTAAMVLLPPSSAAELISELTRLALSASSKAEFRGRALGLLARTLPFDRGAWEEVPPFGEFRVEFPLRRQIGVDPPPVECTSRSANGAVGGLLRMDLERFGRTRAVLIVERDEGAFGADEVSRLRALLPMLILADEGAARSTGVPATRTLTPREADVVQYVRLGYTNAQIALATGRSVAAVRNLLVRIFDKTGVRTRAQLVDGPVVTRGLTPRESEIVQHLRAGLTNREIGQTLGISVNTVRNTLARLFEKVGVSTRSELMGALAEDAGPSGASC